MDFKENLEEFQVGVSRKTSHFSHWGNVDGDFQI
jgi:hypothetical protein